MHLVDRAVERIERAELLDGVASRLAVIVTTALRPRHLRDALSGRQLSHPLHPALVPIAGGALLSATVLDLSGVSSGAAAKRLVGIGLVAAVPATLAGCSDWLDTEQAERRVGLTHAASNLIGLSVYTLSWFRRSHGRSGVASGVVGAAALTVGGWLGGHLVYAQGVGVDTTAFQAGPMKWTDVAASSRVSTGLRRVEVEGVPILLSRVDNDVVAIGERCTHRGGPLADGERVADCVVCPWHGSRFDLGSGEVRSGPATRPQPRYEARERAGRVQVRRHEDRALRINPSGA